MAGPARGSSAFLLAFLILGTLVGCSASDGLVGEWKAEQNGQPVRIVFAADSTFTMDTGDYVGEGRYEVRGSEVVLRPEGALGIAVPEGFTGTLEEWTQLTLCAGAGLCTEFEKIQ